MLAFQDFPSHVRLMLLSARPRLSAPEADQIRELISGPAGRKRPDQTIDWNGFLAVTSHHRLSPLVFDSLDRIRPRGVPDFVREELSHRARLNAFESLRCVGEIERIGERFARAGIELSVLKGVPLSQFLFGNPNVRHVGDIDLLTQPDRLAEQIALLAELGYNLPAALPRCASPPTSTSGRTSPSRIANPASNSTSTGGSSTTASTRPTASSPRPATRLSPPTTCPCGSSRRATSSSTSPRTGCSTPGPT